MQTILVTGGAGFIGGAVVRKLVGDGKIVINLDKLTYAASPEALAAVAGRNNYRFEQADICDAAAVQRILAEHRPDAVMHLAAESHVDRSIDGPATFIQTNVVGTATLLEAVRSYWQDLDSEARGRFRFHHISTDEVFGSLGPEGAFSETTRYQPNSPYSASKAGSDHLVRAWGETYGLPVLVTNCSNNYGPYQFPEKLIPLMIIRGLAGERLPVYGKGDNVRDWLHVEDHARALTLVLERGQPGATYNIGGNAEMANIEVVRTICRLLDQRRPAQAPHERLIGFVTDRPGHDRRYAMDISKIHSELGWTPTETFQSGLERTVDWYLRNESWWRPILARNNAVARLGLGSKRRAAG